MFFIKLLDIYNRFTTNINYKQYKHKSISTINSTWWSKTVPDIINIINP